MAEAVHGLGWKPSLPDIRNYAYRLTRPAAPLPDHVDLRGEMPPIGDQGQLGSCTAWAATAVYRHGMIRGGLGDFDPSELAQYYWSRLAEHTQREDAGATITDAVKVLAKIGMAPESAWPYIVSHFDIPPIRSVRALAKQHMAIQYETVDGVSLAALRGVLADGFPVVFGASVYESFEGDAVGHTGHVPMPRTTEGLLGGHAMVLVGYQDATQEFVVRNSWGTGWGDHGYLYMPYRYVTSTQLCGDFWIIRQVK